MSYFVVLCCFFYMLAVVNQLLRLGKRGLICLLLFTCNYVTSVSSSSGCPGWATLFNCGTPWVFHIIILQGYSFHNFSSENYRCFTAVKYGSIYLRRVSVIDIFNSLLLMSFSLALESKLPIGKLFL